MPHCLCRQLPLAGNLVCHTWPPLSSAAIGQSTECVHVRVHGYVRVCVYMHAFTCECICVSVYSVSFVNLCLFSCRLLLSENSVPGLLSSVYRRVSMSEDSSFYVVHPQERQGFPCFTVVSLFKVRKTPTGQSYSTPGDIQCLFCCFVACLLANSNSSRFT